MPKAISRIKCCIQKCGAKKSDFINRKFFSFHNVNEEHWKEYSIYFENFLIKKKFSICASHFSKACFTGKGYLVTGSVPSLYLNALNLENYIEDHEEVNKKDPPPLFCNLSSLQSPDEDTLDPEPSHYEEYYLTESQDNEPPAIEEEKCIQQECVSSKCLKKIAKLERMLRILRMKNKKYLKQLSIMKKSKGRQMVKKVSKNKNILEEIDNLKGVNKNCKEFSKILLSSNDDFTDNQKWICHSLFYQDKSTYKFIEKLLAINLPTNFDDWLTLQPLDPPGFNDDRLELLKSITNKLLDKSKDVVLVIDEMPIDHSPGVLVNYGNGKVQDNEGETFKNTI